MKKTKQFKITVCLKKVNQEGKSCVQSEAYYMKPKSLTYRKQSLHGHFDGFHVLMLFLKIESDFDFLILSGTIAQIFGARHLIVCKPVFTFFGFAGL